MAVELTRKSFTPYAAKKGEEYMNAAQRKHFRKILESIKAELSQEIDRTVHTMQDEATVFADPNDRASQESDIALELRNRDRERKLIKKIDESIARIDSGEYGYCDSCGVEIGLKRLEARPTATLCIDCKGVFGNSLPCHASKTIDRPVLVPFSAVPLSQPAGLAADWVACVQPSPPAKPLNFAAASAPLVAQYSTGSLARARLMLKPSAGRPSQPVALPIRRSASIRNALIGTSMIELSWLVNRSTEG